MRILGHSSPAWVGILPFLVGSMAYGFLGVPDWLAVMIGMASILPFMKPDPPAPADRAEPAALAVPHSRPTRFLDPSAVAVSGAVIGTVGRIAIERGAQASFLLGLPRATRRPTLESVSSTAAGLAATYGTEVGPITVELTLGTGPDGGDTITCVAYVGPTTSSAPVRRWAIVGFPESFYREVG